MKSTQLKPMVGVQRHPRAGALEASLSDDLFTVCLFSCPKGISPSQEKWAGPGGGTNGEQAQNRKSQRRVHTSHKAGRSTRPRVRKGLAQEEVRVWDSNGLWSPDHITKRQGAWG